MNEKILYSSSRYKDLVQKESNIELHIEDQPSRLNICVPHLHKDYIFGGLSSVLALGKHLSRHYDQIRFLSLAPVPDAGSRLDVTPYAKPDQAARVASFADQQLVTFHPKDVLLCSYWPTVLVWEKLARLFGASGLVPNKFYYFIQDWEPGFYPMGVKYLLAASTYTHGDDCVAIINSVELARFFQIHNIKLHHAVVVRPSLNPLLAATLEKLDYTLPAKDATQIHVLVYGRPEQPRNCFSAILAGIAAYAASYQATDITVNFFSVGILHEDIAFSHGVTLKSLGTLSLQDYASVLLQSHVGIAFMASPHPSYPPLEMACFGLEVLTNTTIGKDLAKGHPHIHSVRIPLPDSIGQKIGQLIALAKKRAGKALDVILPDSLTGEPWHKNFHQADLPKISVER